MNCFLLTQRNRSPILYYHINQHDFISSENTKEKNCAGCFFFSRSYNKWRLKFSSLKKGHRTFINAIHTTHSLYSKSYNCNYVTKFDLLFLMIAPYRTMVGFSVNGKSNFGLVWLQNNMNISHKLYESLLWCFCLLFKLGSLCSLKLHEEEQTYFIKLTHLIFNFSPFVLV